MAAKETKTEPTKEELALAAYEKRETRRAELAAKREAARDKLEGETKADAFKRIAKRRVSNALDALATLENVFDRNNYDYTPDLAAQVVAALEGGLAKVRARAAGEGRAKSGFDFGSDDPPVAAAEEEQAPATTE